MINGYNNNKNNAYNGIKQNLEVENSAYATPNQFQNFVSLYPFISWFDRSDANLRVINESLEFSASASYCVNFIIERALAEGIGIKSKPKGYFSKVEDANENSPEYQQFAEFIDNNFNVVTLIDEMRKIGLDYEQFGGALIELKVSKFGGQYAVSINHHQVMFFRYQALRAGEANVSKGWLFGDWNLSHWMSDSDFKPLEIPIYPNYEVLENVVFRTFIHVKGKGVTTARALYPMPRWYPAINQVALEVSIGKYMLREAKNNFLPVALLETFTGGSEVNPTTKSDRLDINTSNTAVQNNPLTNEGDGKKTNIMIMEQTADTPVSHLHIFPRNLKGEDDKVRFDMTREVIFSAFGIPVALFSQSGGLGNSKERSEAEKIMEATLIKGFKKELIKPFNLCIDIATQVMGLPKFDFELYLNDNKDILPEAVESPNIGGANV
jgi:hypothetical protein